MTTIPTELLSLAGEYAVASHLCRLGHYAQLTFGNRKRTDIMVDAPDGRLFRIEVKTKQGSEWLRVQPPNEGDLAILVDLQRKAQDDTPDFYILTRSDWKDLISEHRIRYPKMLVAEDYSVTWPDGWKGVNLKAEWVQLYRDSWGKMDHHNP